MPKTKSAPATKTLTSSMVTVRVSKPMAEGAKQRVIEKQGSLVRPVPQRKACLLD